jgi:cytochrome c peroxidase/DNA-binding beta-propeller fold protein YncE
MDLLCRQKPTRRPLWLLAFVVLTTLAAALPVCRVLSARHDGSSVRAPAARLHRPVAAAFVEEGRILCVANQGSGTVTLVDVAQGRVRAETTIGKRLADLAVLPDRKHVLTVDEQQHELIALSWDGEHVRVRDRLATAASPVSVAVSADGQRATIASLWSRRLQVVDLKPLTEASGHLGIRHSIRLPFAPRCQCPLPGESQVVVADAFGGRLAVVDAASGKVHAVHRLQGHNLRGLAVSADRKHLLIAHQILDQQTPILEEKIWRGFVMANVVRVVPLAEVRRPRADTSKWEQTIALKGNGKGAGDPAGLAVLDERCFAAALAGVNEVALVADDGHVRRILVGRRPTALVRSDAGQPLVVLNTFDDSLSLVDSRRGLVTGTIELGRPGELTSAERGELLFHDARLSRDGWFSCHSCHPDGHTNGLLADTSSDGSHGTPKRILTLRGTALTDPWAWNGSMKYLQDQIEKSLLDTMHAPSMSGEQINDLLSFLHTLPPPPPLEPATEDKKDREKLERGRKLFEQRGCIRCHIPPLTYSSHETYDVGFADENGLRKFNPPSLRGVGQGERFLHDNRAATLEEVFTKYRHKVGPGLTDEERDDLLRFLRSL